MFPHRFFSAAPQVHGELRVQADLAGARDVEGGLTTHARHAARRRQAADGDEPLHVSQRLAVHREREFHASLVNMLAADGVKLKAAGSEMRDLRFLEFKFDKS